MYTAQGYDAKTISDSYKDEYSTNPEFRDNMEHDAAETGGHEYAPDYYNND